MEVIASFDSIGMKMTDHPPSKSPDASAGKMGFNDILAMISRETHSKAGERRLPPVHLWNPENCGDIQMEIKKDGSWWHEGVRIGRQKLIELFSTIMRKEDDGHIYLVTPVEKIIVHVEDAPFIAIRADLIEEEGDQQIVFTTNVGDVTIAGKDKPLRVVTDPQTGEPSPYILVRGDLEAKIGRAPFYELVNWANQEGDELIIHSSGERFSLGRVKEAV